MLSWGEAVIGGCLVGSAATGIWAINSTHVGHSKLLGKLATGDVGSTRSVGLWLSYLAGILIAGFVLAFSAPFSRLSVSSILDMPWYLYLLGGLALGFGTQATGSCTLNHGVGLGSLTKFICALCVAFVMNNLVHGGFSYVAKGTKPEIAGETLISDYDRNVSIGLVIGTVLLLAITGYAKYYLTHKPNVASYSTALYWLSAFSLMLGAFMIGMGFSFGGFLQQGKTIGALSMYVYWNPHCWIFLATSLVISTIGYMLVRAFGGPVDDALVETVSNSINPTPVSVADLDKRYNVIWNIIGVICVGIAWGMIGWLVGPVLTMIPRLFADSKSFAGVYGTYIISIILGIWIHAILRRIILKEKKEPEISV